VAIKNRLEILTPRTAASDCTWPIRLGIKHGMTRALASPFNRSDLQHYKQSYRATADVLRLGRAGHSVVPCYN
jgi:hypothetical protein